jgi:hypothetical protein
LSQPQPIFVVGSPRSGTSILTWSLGQHPNILPLEETSWIARLTPQLVRLHRIGSARGERSQLSAMGVTREVFFEAFGRAVDEIVRSHRSEYEQLARDAAELRPEQVVETFQVSRDGGEPKQRWVDGTPENSFYVYGLAHLFPQARFIHVVRDVDAVVRSLIYFHTIGGAYYSEDSAYDDWLRHARACLQAEQAFGASRFLRILHRDLASSAETAIRCCLDFLGEPFVPACVAPLETRINQSRVPEDAPIPGTSADPALVGTARALSSELLEGDAPALSDPEALAALAERLRARAYRPGFEPRALDLLRRIVPRTGLVLVATDGDEALRDLEERPTWHFPRDDAGAPIPADEITDEQLIDQLERLREAGGEFFVVPAKRRAWLDAHLPFRDHLQNTYADLAPGSSLCTVFHLRQRLVPDAEGGGATEPAVSSPATGGPGG